MKTCKAVFPLLLTLSLITLLVAACGGETTDSTEPAGPAGQTATTGPQNPGQLPGQPSGQPSGQPAPTGGNQAQNNLQQPGQPAIPDSVQDPVLREWLERQGQTPAGQDSPPDGSSGPSSAEADRAALEALYHATGGDNWENNTNWLSDAPLIEWHGVIANQNGRVISLILNDNNLSGTIPQEFQELHHLSLLNLAGNQLDGCLEPQQQAGLDPAVSNLGGLPACSSDRTALEALYRATGGDSWSASSNWLSDAPIDQWHGVTADATGKVIALNLSHNNLNGRVPPELNELAGLTVLNLDGNQVGGCLDATLQERLDPAQSELGGVYFCCAGQSTEEPVRAAVPPPAQTSAETDRAALIALFDATDGPTWDQSGIWASLRPLGDWAGVTTNEEGRVISVVLNDTTMAYQTKLSGELPPELGHLTALKNLVLNEPDPRRRGDLAGPIPPELGNLGDLEVLNLGGNQFCGQVPPELTSLVNLVEFDLSRSVLSGGIPPELGNLSKLRSLNLSGNVLTGAIPPELGGLANLFDLNLGGNRLTGQIPPELGRLTGLLHLHLGANRLTGEIPAELDNLPYLGDNPGHFAWLRGHHSGLNLGGNPLSGCVSDNLRDRAHSDWRGILDQGSGPLPVCAVSDPEDTQTMIALYEAAGSPGWRNWLSREPLGEWDRVSTDRQGRVIGLAVGYSQANPTGFRAPLGSLGNLQSLTLGLLGSHLEILSELGNLQNLRYLKIYVDYAENGQIPPELGSLANLQYLSVQPRGRFGLTGEIPPELGNLSNLEYLAINLYTYTGEIPRELGNLSKLRVLDLSYNDLSGEIPAELGRLTALRLLKLNNNQLSGELPLELGNLANLENLDLESNALSGEIPPEWGDLDKLSRLKLGGQKDTQGKTLQWSGCIPSALYERLRTETGLRSC